MLHGAFLNSLNEEFKCELATKGLPKSLDAFIAMCVRADDHMREYGKWTGGPRQAGRNLSPWAGSLSAERRSVEQEQVDGEEQPIQLGHAKLSFPD